MITAVLVAACSWSDPGADPYQGRVPEAVKSYADIPAPVRAKLRERMDKRQYDEVATIRRDSIEGEKDSYTGLRDMHFGAGKVCRKVDRRAWTPEMVERGLIYCENEHCLMVPTVCRNVSRVTRIRMLTTPPLVASEPLRMLAALPLVGDGGLPAAAGLAESELSFDPPGAGPQQAPAVVTFLAASGEPLGTALVFTPFVAPWAGPRLPAPAPVIPEPSTWALLLTGLLIVACRVRLDVRANWDSTA